MTQDAFEELHLKTSTSMSVPPSPNKGGVEVKAAMTPPVLVSAQSNENMSSQQNGSIFATVGLLVGIAMSIFGLAFIVQQRRARRSRSSGLFLDRACYIDQTPIRVVMEHIEEGSPVEYDDDVHSVRSECSLEEIELEDNDVASNYREYLQGIRDGGHETYFDKTHDFSNIFGSPFGNERKA